MTLTLQREARAGGLKALRGAVDCILAAQDRDGAIPWFTDGPWDPWNHAECVMALGTAGEAEAAERGLQLLAHRQAPDGSWLGEYGNALPMADRLRLARTPAPAFHDTNFAAYCAVAVWRQVRLSGDAGTARRYWPMVRAAIGFVLSLQHPEGDISWSAEGRLTGTDDAVLAGNASIFKSLECALNLAELVGEDRPDWRAAQRRLAGAILGAPHRFDRGGQDRSGFAMDWYYPVLCGVLEPQAAEARLDAQWTRFVEPSRGCRCVAHEPWATVAESCELALALLAIGRREPAERVYAWQLAHRDTDGAFWMGYQFEEEILWPQERPTWTQAAAILACDALYRITPAWDVLISAE